MLFDRGVYVTLAAYPLVPKHEVGFRLQVTAANTDAEIDTRDRGDRGAGRARRAAARPACRRWSRPRDAPARPPRARRRLAAACLAGGALLCALYVWVPPFAGSGPVMNVLGLAPVIAILAGVRRYRPAAAAPWLLLRRSASCSSGSATSTRTRYPRVFGAEVPFPSIGDGMYLLVYPALMIGLLSLVRRRNPHGDRPGVIDALIMTLGLALVSWVALIAPYIHDDSMDVVAKLVSIAYPVGRHPAPRRRHPPRRRRRPPRPRLRLPRREHRRAARHRLRLRRRHAERRLRRPGHPRRRLDQLLPPVGRRRPAPVDARARASPRRTTTPRASRRSASRC